MTDEETNSGADNPRIVPSGDKDAAASALADRIGGNASVLLEGFGNREFDAISEKYVAQTTRATSAATKPKNFLTMSRRKQIRETLRAAHATGRAALFEFTGGAPAREVIDFINRNSQRIGVAVEIVVRQEDMKP